MVIMRPQSIDKNHKMMNLRGSGALCRFYSALLFVAMWVSSFAVDAESQLVALTVDSSAGLADQPLNVIVNYDTSDGGLASGIGVRLYFDSSQLRKEAITDLLEISRIGDQVQSDLRGFDSAPSTYRYITAGWAGLNRTWPSTESLAVTLFSVESTPSEKFSATSLNITHSSNDAQYDLFWGKLPAEQFAVF